jgi:short subunit dehydrogenase-like uncharacterized protein
MPGGDLRSVILAPTLPRVTHPRPDRLRTAPALDRSARPVVRVPSRSSTPHVLNLEVTVPTVALLGARGLVGSLIAGALAALDIEVVEVPRTAAAPEAGPDAHEAGVLERAVAGCDVIVNAAGGEPGMAERAVTAACGTGAHLVDVVPEQTHIRTLCAAEAPTAAAGIVIVPGAGLQHLVGDTLAHLAGTATRAVREVHVAYTLPDRGAMLADASAGRRRSAARELTAPALALVHGELQSEPIGEQRRLAWFPRPVGPSHAAAVPGGEAITVPRHLPGVETVRTYVALTGGRSELLQFTANLARFERVRERLVRRIERPRTTFGEARRAGIRWGVVAEANGADGVARAWAYGHDPYRLTANAAVACVEAVSCGAAPAGVRSPAELVAPGDLLDVVATRTDMRWSISRPDADAVWPRS